MPSALGIIRSRTGNGRNLRSFSADPQPLQEPLDTRPASMYAGRTAIHPGRTGALITPHANPRHQKERGIADKVVQIIKPAMRIITSPSVQLGLDPQYPALRLVEGVLQLRIAGIHRRTSRHSILLTAGLLAPLALRPALPASAAGRYARDYYGASAPPVAISRRRACPPARLETRKDGRPRAVPTFTSRPFDELGAQLLPRQHRHGYAADLHRGLLTGETNRHRS